MILWMCGPFIKTLTMLSSFTCEKFRVWWRCFTMDSPCYGSMTHLLIRVEAGECWWHKKPTRCGRSIRECLGVSKVSADFLSGWPFWKAERFGKPMVKSHEGVWTPTKTRNIIYIYISIYLSLFECVFPLKIWILGQLAPKRRVRPHMREGRALWN